MNTNNIQKVIQNPIEPQSQFNSKTYYKVNTYTRKPSPQQIFALITMILQLVVFYSILFNKVTRVEYFIIFLFLYSLFLLIMIVSYFVSSCVDPTDSLIINTSKKSQILITRKNTQQCTNTANPAQNQFYQCQYCQADVLKNSKHCRICNRCTQEFDHHCKWINNCIGSKNYKAFFIMTLSALLKAIVFVFTGIYVSFEQNWRQYLGQMITIWIVVIYIAIIAFFLLILVSFHIYLKITNQSTYQIIVNSRKADLERRRQLIKQSLQKREVQRKKSIQRQNQGNLIKQPSLKNKTSLQEEIKKNQKRGNNKVANSNQQSKNKIVFSNFQGYHSGQPVIQQIIQFSVPRNNFADEILSNGQDNKIRSSSSSIGSFINKNKSLKLLIGQIDFVGPKKSGQSILNKKQYLSQRQSEIQKNTQKNMDSYPYYSK